MSGGIQSPCSLRQVTDWRVAEFTRVLNAFGHDIPDAQVRDALLGILYAAPSTLVAIPFQDALGSRERVNVPGTVAETNWTFRMPMDLPALEADQATTDRLAALAADTGRAP